MKKYIIREPIEEIVSDTMMEYGSEHVIAGSIPSKELKAAIADKVIELLEKVDQLGENHD